MVHQGVVSSKLETTMSTETKPHLRTIRLPDVLAKTGLAASSIWRLAQRGHFPAPIKLSPGCTAWFEHEIDDWLNAKAKDREIGTERSLGGAPQHV
jgi:prophage regulatory protein